MTTCYEPGCSASNNCEKNPQWFDLAVSRIICEVPRFNEICLSVFDETPVLGILYGRAQLVFRLACDCRPSPEGVQLVSKMNLNTVGGGLAEVCAGQLDYNRRYSEIEALSAASARAVCAALAAGNEPVSDDDIAQCVAAWPRGERGVDVVDPGSLSRAALAGYVRNDRRHSVLRKAQGVIETEKAALAALWDEVAETAHYQPAAGFRWETAEARHYPDGWSPIEGPVRGYRRTV